MDPGEAFHPQGVLEAGLGLGPGLLGEAEEEGHGPLPLEGHPQAL